MEQTSKDQRKGSVLQSLQLEIIRTHKELHLKKIVHLHQNEHAINIDMDANDYCVPMEVDSALPPTQVRKENIKIYNKTERKNKTNNKYLTIRDPFKETYLFLIRFTFPNSFQGR